MIWARACTCAAVTSMLFVLPSPGTAQPSQVQPDAAGHETMHRHHAGVFGGATTNLAADHTDTTVGIDYEYRLPLWHDRIGIAAFAEFTFAAHDEWILGGGATLYPAYGLKLFAGAGVLFAEAQPRDQPGADAHVSAAGASGDLDPRHPLLRIGAGWEFHAGRVSLTPMLFYDRVKGHGSLVYGVAVGMALGGRKPDASRH